MPEELGTSTEALPPLPAHEPEPGAADDSGALNPWLLLAFVVVAVLVSVQNLWLRRRGVREEQSRDDAG
jgi:hypothetical protein